MPESTIHPLVSLATEIRDVNRANGWNPYNETDEDTRLRVPTILCLIHSEITEAVAGFESEDDDNLIEELADVQIRILDFVGGFKDMYELFVLPLVGRKRSYTYEEFEKDFEDVRYEFLVIHSMVSEALESHRGKDKNRMLDRLAMLFNEVEYLAEHLELDLELAIQKKIEKNKARGFRHGGKLV